MAYTCVLANGGHFRLPYWQRELCSGQGSGVIFGLLVCPGFHFPGFAIIPLQSYSSPSLLYLII
jgi:hypothetical protein